MKILLAEIPLFKSIRQFDIIINTEITSRRLSILVHGSGCEITSLYVVYPRQDMKNEPGGILTSVSL